jgi:hypothetical protein
MRRIALAALLAAVSGSALANDAAGWHAGASATFGDFSSKVADIPLNDNTIGFKGYVQYQFNKYLAVEGAYYTSGQFSSDIKPGVAGGDAKLRLHGGMGDVLGYVPWISSEDLKFFGKIGYFDFTDNLSVDGNTVSSASENGVTLGAGAVVKVSDQFDVRADFDWFDADVGHLWSLNLGVQYNFGARHKASGGAGKAPAAEAPAAEAPAAPTSE